MNKMNYGEWVLEDTFGESAKTPKFFDNVEDRFKDKIWVYMMVCAKDLGWTDIVAFDPTSPPENEQRSITTQSQYEAFVSVMSSIYSADLLQDKVRLGPEGDTVITEEEQALKDMRHYLDIVAALMLKYGPYEGTRARTLDLRLGFINELMHFPNLKTPRDCSIAKWDFKL